MQEKLLDKYLENSDLVKFVMCTLVSSVHMSFHKLTKGYLVPGNQGTYDKFNPFQKKKIM